MRPLESNYCHVSRALMMMIYFSFAVSMGRSRSTPGLVESKSASNAAATGDTDTRGDTVSHAPCASGHRDQMVRSESTCQPSSHQTAPNLSLTRASPVSDGAPGRSSDPRTGKTKALSSVHSDQRHIDIESSTSKQQVYSDSLQPFKSSMSSALSAPHLAPNQPLEPMITPTGATFLNAPAGMAASYFGDTSSSSAMCKTPVPGEMSQEVLIAEIKRLRDKLHLLEYENATMTCKLNQQTWEVNNRLTEIECQIGVTSTSSATSIPLGHGHSARDAVRHTAAGETSRFPDESDDKEYRRYLNHHLPHPSGMTSSPASPITASSSDSITLDESEKNRESVI